MSETKTPQERAAIVTFRLAAGERMTTRQAAVITGLSPTGAWYLMARISRVVPITQIDGEWCVTTAGAGGIHL